MRDSSVLFSLSLGLLLSHKQFKKQEKHVTKKMCLVIGNSTAKEVIFWVSPKLLFPDQDKKVNSGGGRTFDIPYFLFATFTLLYKTIFASSVLFQLPPAFASLFTSAPSSDRIFLVPCISIKYFIFHPRGHNTIAL